MCNLWFLDDYGSQNPFFIDNLPYIHSQIQNGHRFDFIYEKESWCIFFIQFQRP